MSAAASASSSSSKQQQQEEAVRMAARHRSLHAQVAEYVRLRCDSVIDASQPPPALAQAVSSDSALPLAIAFDGIGGCDEAKAALTQATAAPRAVPHVH
jgi:hypothetical protein